MPHLRRDHDQDRDLGSHREPDRDHDTRVHDRDHEVRDREVRDRDVRDRPAGVVGRDHEAAREKFGGVNLGACFFGWLVAIGVTVLLTGIIAAIASAVGYSEDITQSTAEANAGTVGLVSAIVLIVVLLIGYYAGGYVAGRMSRFDGTRQGVTVWAIGLIVTLLAAAAGWIAGNEYNVLDQVNMPQIPIPEDQLSTGGIITGLIILVGTLLAAMAGGAVGRRYHGRVDREELHRT